MGLKIKRAMPDHKEQHQKGAVSLPRVEVVPEYTGSNKQQITVNEARKNDRILSVTDTQIKQQSTERNRCQDIHLGHNIAEELITLRLNLIRKFGK